MLNTEDLSVNAIDLRSLRGSTDSPAINSADTLLYSKKTEIPTTAGVMIRTLVVYSRTSSADLSAASH
jgi:hypothetical protein